MENSLQDLPYACRRAEDEIFDVLPKDERATWETI